MNKYQQTPEYILDLHGMTCVETKTALRELICGGKYSHVRIITGKGTFREKSGVLRDFVKSFLQENHIRFNPSKIADGGEGSFEVYL
jgi:DNA-nicking Smr family endonuclease